MISLGFKRFFAALGMTEFYCAVWCKSAKTLSYEWNIKFVV